jgi:hypothetical protein
MTEQQVRELLRHEATAAEREAEERAWPVVREAFEQRSPKPPRRSRRNLVLATVGAVAVAGLALSPAGAEVTEWIADAVEPGVERAAPTLAELPGGGSLLVESTGGTWTVAADGSLRSLGDYDDATRSPEGPFAAVTSGDRLLAVVADPEHPLAAGQPAGTVRWSIPGEEPMLAPSWSPSGYRVAYLGGGGLNVVAGDGTGDRGLDGSVMPVAPAWAPAASANRLAYVDVDGSVRLVDVDSRRMVWSGRPLSGTPKALAWRPDSALLAALGAHGLSLIVSRPGSEPFGAGYFRFGAATASGDLDVSSRGHVALVRHRRRAGAVRSELILIDARHPRAGERRLFAGPGRFTDVAFSPDGEWVLFGWKDADQWLFIRPGDGEVRAVSDISAQFDPGSDDARFPRVEGWCCR